MYKLDLEKAEEPESKLSKFTGSQRKQRNSRKVSTFPSLISKKPLTVQFNKLWNILKEMGIPDHFTCLLRNLYARQEATVRTGHGTMDWFKTGKEYIEDVYCCPDYLTSMQSTAFKMLGQMTHKL